MTIPTHLILAYCQSMQVDLIEHIRQRPGFIKTDVALGMQATPNRPGWVFHVEPIKWGYSTGLIHDTKVIMEPPPYILETANTQRVYYQEDGGKRFFRSESKRGDRIVIDQVSFRLIFSREITRSQYRKEREILERDIVSR